MNLSSKMGRYLRCYAVRQSRPIRMRSEEGIERVVVIPVLAESASLFKTLARISENRPDLLRSTLILCVVNNHPPQMTTSEAFCDNQKTLSMLWDLLHGAMPLLPVVEARCDFERIIRSDLRFGFVDASSPGLEIPERDGGVGAARKIGMDAALTLFEREGLHRGEIFCLDADTLVEPNYLEALRRHFHDTRDPAAVVKYAHQNPLEYRLHTAICRYEIFLRAYVIGLSFAGSPYAFHSIGSTMACTARAYVDVRGMNRRKAAEDFHFLNKLAKIGRIGTVSTTTVYPSPRLSTRVPFGTGRSMVRFINGETDEYRLYHADIYTILREWLAEMDADPYRDSGQILEAACKIHPGLKGYLDLSRFPIDWPLICRNCPDAEHLRHQFHVWFDGLKTLRLVRHLSRTAFAPVGMLEGVKDLLQKTGRRIPVIEDIPHESAEPDLPFRILRELRAHFPHS